MAWTACSANLCRILFSSNVSYHISQIYPGIGCGWTKNNTAKTAFNCSYVTEINIGRSARIESCLQVVLALAYFCRCRARREREREREMPMLLTRQRERRRLGSSSSSRKSNSWLKAGITEQSGDLVHATVARRIGRSGKIKSTTNTTTVRWPSNTIESNPEIGNVLDVLEQ